MKPHSLPYRRLMPTRQRRPVVIDSVIADGYCAQIRKLGMATSAILRISSTAFVLCALALAVPIAEAADRDARGGWYAGPKPSSPRYYGLYEPWSRMSERPPRKGAWVDTQKPNDSVGALVPMHNFNDFVRPEPWTPAWFRYCAQRWDSFDPKTGTIQTPDGVRMCM